MGSLALLASTIFCLGIWIALGIQRESSQASIKSNSIPVYASPNSVPSIPLVGSSPSLASPLGRVSDVLENPRVLLSPPA